MKITGTYGSEQTPCNIFVHNNWYCVKGSKNVNLAGDLISDGVDVEQINDIDTFTWNEPINTEEELITVVES